jgi:predicted DNA-binding transcriptional regulator AlpA
MSEQRESDNEILGSDAATGVLLGVTAQTIKRYAKDAKLKFPKARMIKNRNTRSRREVLEWWASQKVSEPKKMEDRR